MHSLSNNVKKTYARYAAIVLLLFMLCMLVLFPARYLDSATRGAELFALGVLPALLPFFFLTGLINLLNTEGAGGGKIVSRLFNTPPVAAFVMLSAYLSGYPVGVKLTADLYTSGRISATDARRLVAVCSTTGPMFILGSVGSYMLRDMSIAVMVLVSHYLGNLLNGLLYRGRGQVFFDKTFAPSPLNRQNVLREAMNGAVLSVLAVGGFVICSYVLIDICADVGLLHMLSLLFRPVAHVAQCSDSAAFGIAAASAVLEMTRGTYALSALDVSRAAMLIMLTAAVTWGGVSVILQSLMFTTTAGVGTRYFLQTRLTATVLATAVAAVFSLFV